MRDTDWLMAHLDAAVSIMRTQPTTSRHELANRLRLSGPRSRTSLRAWKGRGSSGAQLAPANRRRTIQMRPKSWRSDYTSRAEIILEDEPDITREKLAEEMDLPLDFIDDLLAQIRPTRISPKPVMNHQLGRFR
jgi:hypothetical protein